MTVMGFLLLVLVGAICGSIAEVLLGSRPFGFLASTFVGVIGALLGGWFALRLPLPSLLTVRMEGHTVDVLWSMLGAMVSLLVMSVLRGINYYRRPLREEEAAPERISQSVRSPSSADLP